MTKAPVTKASMTKALVTKTLMNKTLHAVQGWLLVMPALVLLIAFTHYPALATLWQSVFSTPHGEQASHFVGLENYLALRSDPVFWQALINTFLYALVTVPVSVLLALAMALWANHALAGQSFLRMAYFTPTVLPMVAVANIWLFFYTPQYGLIAQVLGWFGLPSVNWLGQRGTALWAIMMVEIWKESGFFMVFYLAALQAVPTALADAARLEGASRWQTFYRVILPLLMPTTLFVLINALINAFRVVDHVAVMTQGGPDNASMLLMYYIYQVGFSFWDSAYAATLTVLLLVVLGAIAVVKFRILDKRTHYQ